MLPKAILFDLDETLAAEVEATQGAFTAACQLAEERFEADPAKLKEAIAQVGHKLWDAGPHFNYLSAIGTVWHDGLTSSFKGQGPFLEDMRYWALDYRKEAWTTAAKAVGIDDSDFVAEVNQQFVIEKAMRYRPFAGAWEMVKAMRGRFKLGVVTNGIPDVQLGKLERTRFAGLFDHIMISGQVGIGKPDPMIFHLALECLEVEPGEALMVGDNFHKDIGGAKKAGLRAVWVNVNNSPVPEPDVSFEAQVRLVTELPDLLKKWAQK